MVDLSAIKDRLLSKRKPKEDRRWGLSTGLTLLNLACTGSPDYGLLPSFYYPFVGGSRAGKTWLAWQCLAEAANDERFDKYDLVSDSPERGNLMSVPRFFGERLAKRVKTPKKGPSRTLGDFYKNCKATIGEKPTIYVLDSEDALVPDDDRGGYNLEKAKMNSSELRKVNNWCGDTNSILIMIKQSRMRIGFGSQFDPETRSGGTAITFYATQELWFKRVGKIKKSALGKQRNAGDKLRIQLQKNRATGNECSITIPFYRTFGFDNTGSLVNWLVEEGHWKSSKGEDADKVKSIRAPEFRMVGSAEKIIHKIEESGQEDRLKEIVVDVWNAIEAALTVKRKARYA